MRRYGLLFILCIIFPPFANVNVSAQIRLVADLNQDESSVIRVLKPVAGHVSSGSRLFFTTDEESGQELWTSDGTDEGTYLLKHFVQIQQLHVLGELLIFVAVTDAHGFELWKSDGTVSGTVLLKDIYPGAGSSSPSYLTNVEGTLYFSANNKTKGRELWKSDGTTGGTTMVSDIRRGTSSSNVEKITAFGTSVLFVANDGATGYELWKSDGTNGGTRLVEDIYSYPGQSSAPDDITVANGIAFFSARSENADRQLFKSDGTSAGTSLVKVIRPGGYNAHIDKITAVGNLVFFEAYDGIHGAELWTSDGTEDGTFLLKDITPGPESNGGFTEEHIADLTAINGKLFFTAVSDFVPDLWVSDGTPDGTKVIASGNDLALYLAEPNFVPLGGEALFVGVTVSTLTFDLYKSDGNGITFVKELGPSTIAATPRFAWLNNSYHFFTSEDYWKTNGTATGTIKVKSMRSAPGILITLMHDLDGTLLFGLEDFPPGGFWRTNGTPGSTTQINNIFARDEIESLNHLAYFPAQSSGPASPWRSDGTSEGTFQLSSDAIIPAEFTPANGSMFFTAEGPLGRELYKTDGSAANTVLVKDIVPGPDASDPVALESLNNNLYFFAYTVELGYELWKTDGSDAGTMLVIDSQAGPGGLQVSSSTRLGNLIFFVADDGVHGQELWRSDGTAAGTYMVADIRSGDNDESDIGTPIAIDNALLFLGLNESRKVSLWKATNTAVTKLHDFEKEQLSDIHILGATSDQIFFAFYNEEYAELWRSNGTITGTVNLRKFRGVTDCCLSDGAAVRDGVIYFGLAHTVWRSDGTSNGTYSLPFSGFTREFAASGPYVYFHGYSFEYGSELFLIEGEGQTAAASESIIVQEQPDPSVTITSYPNPFRSSFTLRVNGKEDESFSVKVVTADGRVINEELVLNCNADHVLGSGWRDGLYFLRLRRSNNASTIKVVKISD
jgi:ELWxxDGT repeat protein